MQCRVRRDHSTFCIVTIGDYNCLLLALAIGTLQLVLCNCKVDIPIVFLCSNTFSIERNVHFLLLEHCFQSWDSTWRSLTSHTRWSDIEHWRKMKNVSCISHHTRCSLYLFWLLRVFSLIYNLPALVSSLYA